MSAGGRRARCWSASARRTPTRRSPVPRSSPSGTAPRDRALGGLGDRRPDPHGLPRRTWPRFAPWPATSATCWPRAEAETSRWQPTTSACWAWPASASDTDIKRAYRRLARDLHPDVNPDPGAKERFQEVTRAYEALTDPEKRRIVDLGGDPFDTGGGGGGGGFGGAGFGGLGDIMDAFFGGAATRGPRSRTRAGRDALIPIELELDETVFGITKEHHRRHRRPLRPSAPGAGTAPGTHADHLHHLLRARRGAERAARLPRPGRLQPRLPDLRRAPARSSPSRAASAPATAASAPAAPSR